MTGINFTLNEDYWESFAVQDEDIEFLYRYLLEVEEPQSPLELIKSLVEDRLSRERKKAEKKRASEGKLYLPKEAYKQGDQVVFPSMGFQTGTVSAVRPAKTTGDLKFNVIEVDFEGGESKEFASGLEDHALNIPPEISADDPLLSTPAVVDKYGSALSSVLVEGLRANDDFVYIAGRWFPRALLVDVNIGNLNLAEAVLDMNQGGPIQTVDLIEQIDMPSEDNQRLSEFSLDLALQDDERFDEVGSTGKVFWFLKRLEPEDVLKPPIFLRYEEQEHDRTLLNEQMLSLEKVIDDEHSAIPVSADASKDSQDVTLIYPHWRSGTLPLSPRMAQFFPSAYESPRIMFSLIDGKSGDKFSGWVVRLEKYVYGLSEWYEERGVMPGSIIKLSRGEHPGEVIVDVDTHRSNKEWVRTALVGADGKVVYATLKQTVSTAFDDRMMVYMPSETSALDEAWKRHENKRPVFEQMVVNATRELAKLNPQMHVHVAELYSALNVVLRCPPGPLMALLESRPWFSHVGDLHYRLDDSQV